MKTKFEEPSIEVVELKNIDVVTASSCDNQDGAAETEALPTSDPTNP